MKTNLTIILVAFFCTFTAQAQEQGVFKFDGGLAYGSKSGTNNNFDDEGKLGWSIGAEYFFSDIVSGHIGYTRFSKSSLDFSGIATIDIWLTTVDFDLRYYFSSDATLIYGLVGFSSVTAHAEIDGEKASEGENGFNAGLGAIIPMSDKVGFNLQGKWHKLPDAGQFVANAGISFRVN